ncbi:MAG: FKBP-type peptidyl-prolyl cis-trans isomerase [Prevotella sp.]|nr:FKBP-type peptidyl-prolyl cis-trans isomerase [Prevotella sp.]
MLPDVVGRFEGTVDTIEPDVFFRGFIDGVNNDTTVFKSIDGAGAFYKVSLNEDIEEKNLRLYGANRDAGRRFLEQNKQDTSVVVLPSGLQYRVLTAGTGNIPKATETVKVNYEGRLVDGTVFDASKRHGNDPAQFRANQVIQGWTEALTRMPVGSKWQLYIPYELAYGEREQGQIKPFSMLIFDVELVDIVERPAVAPTPKKEVKKVEAPKKVTKKPAKKKKK